jgi:hypothetical protein
MEKINLLKSPKNFHCEFCDYYTSYSKDFRNHKLTRKHKTNVVEIKMSELEIKKSPNEEKIYDCKTCIYTTINKSDYEKHCNTRKHKNALMDDSDKKQNICNLCNKYFSNASGLWKHRKKCTIIPEDKEQTQNNQESFMSMVTSELFIEFIKQNKDIQNVILEQHKDLQNTLIAQNTAHQKQILELSQKQSSIITTNSHNTTNNQFNLNFFLNETCKDAMNITDFVNSLKLTTSDFENTGRLGYIEGISRIIINGLKDVDVEKRPIHCTDLKRETVYIKHDNTWEKEEPDKKKLKWAVNSVARLNLQQIDIWQEENPEYKISDSTKNYEYLKYCSAALGGQYKEEHEKFAEKIMKNVLKNVVIDKHG